MNIRGAYGAKDPETTEPKTFGERLRRIRIGWGWSQERLAEALGTNQRLISHWELGIANPSAAAMTSLSSILGFTPEALLTGKGFTIPDMPALVEGTARDTVAQFLALSRLLPSGKDGAVTTVDIDAFQAQHSTLAEAVKTMKAAKSEELEIWVVVRKRKG